MPLCGGYDADSHDPIYIAYDREGIHYACLEKINLVQETVELRVFVWIGKVLSINQTLEQLKEKSL